jgi:hypothetical protein
MHLIIAHLFVNLVLGRIPTEWEKKMHSFYQEYKEEAPKGSQNILPNHFTRGFIIPGVLL